MRPERLRELHDRYAAERRGQDRHEWDEDDPEPFVGMVRYLNMKDLQRIEKELTEAESRLRGLKDLADKYHAKGATALLLEQRADDNQAAGMPPAEVLADREQARLLRAECQHWAEQRDFEAQTIVGLKAEREALRKQMG